jgi:glucose/arabinose dehydrogenase
MTRDEHDRGFRMKSSTIAISIALLLTTGLVAAQQKPASLSAASQAARPAPGAIEPDAVRDAGLRVAMAVDAGQVERLWDEATAVTKKSVTRDAFIAGISRSRQGLAKAATRNWLSVRRQSGDGNALPPGLYASAEFLAEFPGKPLVRELISFRLDEDGAWRFAGYVVQQ